MDTTETVYATPPEVEKLLRISPNTLKRLAKNGDVPALRVGRQLRFDIAKVVESLELEPSNA